VFGNKTVKQSQIKVFAEKYLSKNLRNSLIMSIFTSENKTYNKLNKKENGKFL